MCYRSLNKVCALIYSIKLCNDSVTVCAVVRRALCSVVFILQNGKGTFQKCTIIITFHSEMEGPLVFTLHIV